MKVTRYKKANKRVNFYINNFGYHQPIQILIDGTFCFAAMKVKNLNFEMYSHKKKLFYCRINL